MSDVTGTTGVARGTSKRGPGRPRAFNRDEARELRRLNKTEGVTLKDLAQRFGKSIATIQKAVAGAGTYKSTL